MISDSVPWKDELLRIAAGLERRKHQRRWTERSMHLFERDVMFAAYSIRKLLEARKVSDELVGRSWRVTTYPRTGPTPDVWNWWEPENLYDLETPTKSSLSTMELCHQIVHSYMFFPTWDWDESVRVPVRLNLRALCFVSERRRSNLLYEIGIDELIKFIFEVGDEAVIGIEMRANSNGERFISRVTGVNRADPRHRSSQAQSSDLA